MRKHVFLAMLSLFLMAGSGCTGINPDYCDEAKPCGVGLFCDLKTHSCHPKADVGGAIDGTVDGGVDTTGDTTGDAVPTPDAASDLPGDTVAPTHDAAADLVIDAVADTLKKANGASCAVGTECASGICQATEKVCCDKSCTGACESCALAAKKGTCSLKPATTLCGAADACVDGASSSYIEKHRCDGSSASCPKTTVACVAPYKCSSTTACATVCLDNDDCTTGLCDVYDKKNTCPKASDICFVDAKSAGGTGTQASPYDTINKCLATTKVYVSIADGTYNENLSISGKQVSLVASTVQPSPFTGGKPSVKLISTQPQQSIKITSGSGCNFSYSDVKGWAIGSGILDLDPQFTSSSDYSLKQTSPCKNKGTTSGLTIPAKDLAGNNRIVGSSVDMGAYEIQ